MRLRVLLTTISFSIVTLFASCESKPDVKVPSTLVANVTIPTDSTILAAIYGKSAGDSAVYDKGKLVESSSPDSAIVAKLLQKQVFQRHDSTLCLVTTKNEFDWGAGVHSGWVDAALFQYAKGAWKLAKVHRQAVWGGAFGICDCRAQAQQVKVANGNKLLVFVRSENVHQGEFEDFNVVTEDLSTSSNDFTTYASRNLEECAGDINLDSLKTGFFIKHVLNQDDRIELVSYGEQKKRKGCVGVYKKKYFSYDQLLKELKKPHIEAD